MRSMSQVRLFLQNRSVKLLKLVLSPSRESDEAETAYSSGFWHDSRLGNAVEQHDSEGISHCHERRFPDAGRVHWAARGAVCDRYVPGDAYPGVV